MTRNETVFDRAEDRGSVIGVELRFGLMEEPNVERYLADIARHKEIDQPTHPRQWIVHVSHENLLPAKRMNQTAAFPPVPIPAPRLSPRLLRLWPW